MNSVLGRLPTLGDFCLRPEKAGVLGEGGVTANIVTHGRGKASVAKVSSCSQFLFKLTANKLHRDIYTKPDDDSRW